MLLKKPLNLIKTEHSEKRKIKMWNIYWPLSKCFQKCNILNSIQNLPWNGYENEIKDNDMLEYGLYWEDYWMKTLHTVYSYGLNERTNLWIKIDS